MLRRGFSEKGALLSTRKGRVKGWGSWKREGSIYIFQATSFSFSPGGFPASNVGSWFRRSCDASLHMDSVTVLGVRVLLNLFFLSSFQGTISKRFLRRFLGEPPRISFKEIFGETQIISLKRFLGEALVRFLGNLYGNFFENTCSYSWVNPLRNSWGNLTRICSGIPSGIFSGIPLGIPPWISSGFLYKDSLRNSS